MSKKRLTINDADRRQWILNDEGLYLLWKDTRLGLPEYIKANREFIDEVIRNVLEGRKPAHYLRYGG